MKSNRLGKGRGMENKNETPKSRDIIARFNGNSG